MCVFVFFRYKKVIIVRARIWVDDKSFVCYGQKVEKCVFPQKEKKARAIELLHCEKVQSK